MIHSQKERKFLGAKGLIAGHHQGPGSPNEQPGASALQQALQKKRMKAGQSLAAKSKVISGNPVENMYNPEQVLPPG